MFFVEIFIGDLVWSVGVGLVLLLCLIIVLKLVKYIIVYEKYGIEIVSGRSI